ARRRGATRRRSACAGRGQRHVPHRPACPRWLFPEPALSGRLRPRPGHWSWFGQRRGQRWCRRQTRFRSENDLCRSRGCLGTGVPRMRALTARVLSLWSKENTMKRRSILSVSAKIALGLALFGITAGSTARAAEIKLLCAVALQPAMIALIPEVEKSSGHIVTIAYGTAGAVANRVQKGEAADIVISAGPVIDQLQAQG